MTQSRLTVPRSTRLVPSRTGVSCRRDGFGRSECPKLHNDCVGAAAPRRLASLVLEVKPPGDGLIRMRPSRLRTARSVPAVELRATAWIRRYASPTRSHSDRQARPSRRTPTSNWLSNPPDSSPVDSTGGRDAAVVSSLSWRRASTSSTWRRTTRRGLRPRFHWPTPQRDASASTGPCVECAPCGLPRAAQQQGTWPGNSDAVSGGPGQAPSLTPERTENRAGHCGMFRCPAKPEAAAHRTEPIAPTR
jgi:hypothetical protein